MSDTLVIFNNQTFTVHEPSAANLDLKRFVHVVALIQESNNRLGQTARDIIAAKDDPVRVDQLLDENFAQTTMLEVLFRAADRQTTAFLGSFENSQSLLAVAYFALGDDLTKKIDFFYALIRGFRADSDSTKKS